MQLKFTPPTREIILENLTDLNITAGIKMMDFYIFMMIIIFTVFLPFSAFAGNESNSGEPVIFSDQELDKYKKPSDNNRTEKTTNTQGKKQYSSSRANKTKRNEERLKKYWCNKGTKLRKKVEKAKDMYAKAKKNYSDNKTLYYYKKISSCRYNSSKTNLEQTDKNLKKAEKTLNDAENKAHRDWIPPGWLRCQF